MKHLIEQNAGLLWLAFYWAIATLIAWGLDELHMRKGKNALAQLPPRSGPNLEKDATDD